MGMQRAKIRRWLLVALVLVFAVLMLPSLRHSARQPVPPARKSALFTKHQGNPAPSRYRKQSPSTGP